MVEREKFRYKTGARHLEFGCANEKYSLGGAGGSIEAKTQDYFKYSANQK